ncbi:putative nuclease HARBI1 [Tanacetum coccineum]
MNSFSKAVDLLSSFVGTISPQNGLVLWDGACFGGNEVRMEFMSGDDGGLGGGVICTTDRLIHLIGRSDKGWSIPRPLSILNKQLNSGMSITNGEATREEVIICANYYPYPSNNTSCPSNIKPTLKFIRGFAIILTFTNYSCNFKFLIFGTIFGQRRFRMRKHLFIRIVDSVTANDRYFQQRRDATGRQSLSSLQKCTGAMRVLAYGVSFDAVDEYLRMSGAVTRKSLMSFVQGVISCFGDEYFRRPNEDDLARLLNIGEQRGMHWQWKNCPTGWAGQYAGRSGKPTIILEAVASYDLWIWHAFFGTPGSCNDINVLHRSPVFNDVLEGQTPKVSYVVNGKQKNMAYYLTDSIYPSWAAFVKSITSPQITKSICCLLNIKRSFEKMWNGHLEFYKLVSHSFDIHVLFGTTNKWDK